MLIDRARPIWDRAVADGIVTAATPEAALVTGGDLSRRSLAISGDGRAAAEQLGAPTVADLIDRAIEILIDTLTGRLETVAREAAQRQWSPERYAQEIREAGARFRAAESQPATYNLIVNPGATAAARQVGALADFAAAVPYRVYRIRGINTRPNHAALEGFTWRKGWEGESVVIPPNGWNCFCRILPVDYVTALALGWEGETPLGTAQLAAFLALGGPDEGFDKSGFV